MNKICTIVSVPLAIIGFVSIFGIDIITCCIIGAIALFITILGFYCESKAKYFWNEKFNKLIYLLSHGDRDYEILSKECTYVCKSNNHYEFEKRYKIKSKCNDLDRITDRFAWSAPSNNVVLLPIVSGDSIRNLMKQDLWTYYTIYFNHPIERNAELTTGVKFDKLDDPEKQALPFLSISPDRKTKKLILKVCFDGISPPTTVKFSVFSNVNTSCCIHECNLEYDSVIGGFVVNILYPRQNWKYSISW